jgi:microcystin degradation protein MlrC
MSARPSGTVDEVSENYFKKNIFDKLKVCCHKIDAIFLVLHGAMVSKNHDDFEGDLLEEIQRFLTKENISVPIVAVLDLHANVSDNMIKYSTCVYAYRKNPHSDARETAVKAS